MTKITPEHLARSAIVYIRQSSPHQVVNNLESQRRQYGLVERGRQLGWSDVQVIDDDLGRSADGIARPGFEKLLARICEGGVGAVLSIEASRLARNGRDWHTLLEFCGLVNCLIVDEDRIYDPRQPDDRMVLGMKGTMSEMELSILRQRSAEARKQKARRGELFGIVAGAVRNVVGISARRNLRQNSYSILCGEFNWLSDRFGGEGLPSIDFAHVDLSRCQQRPEQHGRGVGGWQHGLGFDASFELLVQAFDGVGGSCALPLA